MKKNVKLLNLILPLISIGLILIVWVISAKAVNNSYLLPSLIDTVNEFFVLFTKSEFYLAVLNTFLRSLIAFMASFLIATLLAIISSKSEKAKRFLAPIISIIRTLPTIAVVLLLLVWTNSQVAPVIVTSLVVLPTVYVSVQNALNTVDEKLIEMCRVYNVSEKNIFTKVKLPQIAVPMLSVAGTSLSLNLKLMVAAEVLSYTTQSIGGYLYLSKLHEQTALMMALVSVTVIIGLVVELIFSALSKKVGKWL